jgi:hypothetical protein
MNKVKVTVKDNKFDYYGYRVELVKTTPTNWAYMIEGFDLVDNASGFSSKKEAIEAAVAQAKEDLHRDCD